jgi:hypothetical protein
MALSRERFLGWRRRGKQTLIATRSSASPDVLLAISHAYFE